MRHVTDAEQQRFTALEQRVETLETRYQDTARTLGEVLDWLADLQCGSDELRSRRGRSMVLLNGLEGAGTA